MIHPHQLISKADGSSVLAEQIVVGDELPDSTVTGIERIPTKDWIEVFLHSGPSLLVSADHRFVDSKRGVMARDLTIDTTLTGSRIDGLVRIAAPAKAVAIQVSSGRYALRGIMSHSDEVA